MHDVHMFAVIAVFLFLILCIRLYCWIVEVRNFKRLGGEEGIYAAQKYGINSVKAENIFLMKIHLSAWK